MSRELIDIRIAAGTEIGFYIQEAGSIVACFRSAAEVAQWVEDRLRQMPGEAEREATEQADVISTLPSIARQSKWRMRG